MNKLFIVACKTFGVFQLYWALASLLNVAYAANMGKLIDDKGKPFNLKFHLMLLCIYSFLLFFFAFIMIFETDLITRIVGLSKKEEIPHLPPQSTLMKTGLLLMGIYFLLSSIPNLARNIADLYLFVKRNEDTSLQSKYPDYWAQLIPVLCQIGLAIWIIVKPEAIIQLISRKKKNA